MFMFSGAPFDGKISPSSSGGVFYYEAILALFRFINKHSITCLVHPRVGFLGGALFLSEVKVTLTSIQWDLEIRKV